MCFAVPDLDAAMQELHEMTGVTFGTPIHDELAGLPYSIVFTDAAPRIELISGVAGSPWETDVPRFHHLGWWSSCLSETVSAWTRTGASIAFDGRQYARRFVYADGPRSGITVEAVESSQRARFTASWGM